MTNILDSLDLAWSNARQGKGGFIQIVGNVGSGKTTLLNRFLESIDSNIDEAGIVSMRCGDGGMVRPSDRGELEELIARVTEGVRVIEWSPGEETQTQSVQWLLPGGDFLAAATHVGELPALAGSPRPPSRAKIHAGLLFDVARNNPILLMLDDIHRTDEGSRHVIQELALALQADPTVYLLVVCTSTQPLERPDAPEPWMIEAATVKTMPKLSSDEIESVMSQGFVSRGIDDRDTCQEWMQATEGNPLIMHALLDKLDRITVLRRTSDGKVKLPSLPDSDEYQGLLALAAGRCPELRADVRADLQTAAVIGTHFSTDLIARVWSVPEDAALVRIHLLVGTGLVVPDADGWSFLSRELAAQWADDVPTPDRRELHARIAAILRVKLRFDLAGHPSRKTGFDVTETWNESRRRDHRERKEMDALWLTAQHFSAAGRPGDAAEAAVTLVEQLFESSGGSALLASRQGRQSDRERRHRIYAALTEAVAQLNLAKKDALGGLDDDELLAIRVRILTVRSRFKMVMGDFSEARVNAEMARELTMRLKRPDIRLAALRTQLEVCYASGDTNAARAALVNMLDALNKAEGAQALPHYLWLAEAFTRWEWPGLHDRLFPYVLDQAKKHGGHNEVLQISLEWLAAMILVSDQDAITGLLDNAIRYAKANDNLPFLAEHLARYAAEMIQTRVDSHYDLLSGEFYVPDLFAEGFGPQVPPLEQSLEHPAHLMALAVDLAKESERSVAVLRVSTTALAIILETRERLAEIVQRWLPVHGDEKPVRLTELSDFLSSGFFGITHIEKTMEEILEQANDLGLYQIMADTVYESLDRELPGAIARNSSLFTLAKNSYERVNDAYGLITLSLVEIRYQGRRGEDTTPTIDEALDILRVHHDQLSPEQAAFAYLRFGELLLDHPDRGQEATGYLEDAMRLYDRAGDVDHLHMVGTILHEVYRKQGDLARYRAIRERFRTLDHLTPGSDPLRLELRIEHLLSMARQEANDERAIAMVEHCIQLFGRVPDGTTRIDECFVEISKICRRRADEADNETGFNNWLERSLEAVRIAISINRGLGNYYRVFEELHELFDDLLGLGLYEEYLRVRAENRELAFAVGNIGELLYLFEEHLHYDAETGSEAIRLPEVRSFYEALMRYLLGMGANEDARSIRTAFIGFLTALGEVDLAETYRLRPLDIVSADAP